MSMLIAAIVYLYIVGAAGFGAALLNYNASPHRRTVGVTDMLMIVVWPLSALVWLVVEFVGEFRK